VLPLALFMLMALALLVALLFEGAVQELRTARGEVAGARAQAAAATALADQLATHPDSAQLALPRGAVSARIEASGAETTRVVLQSLGGGMVRVSAHARAWSGGMRADAEHTGLFRIVADSAGPPGGLSFRRIPGWWWAQLP
jgi:hypothetical protein